MNQQLSLLDYQPEPELMESAQVSLELPTKAVNQYALNWHYAGLHYYRRLMLRFMTLPSAETPGKQTARRHIISHLHRLSEECSTKIKQLGGD